MRHVILFSGGIASAAVALRLRKRMPGEPLTLLFTDTKQEDVDLYRFLSEMAVIVDGDLAWAADGRDVWQVFDDEKMIGNTRADICSRILKREVSRRWLKEHCDPADTLIHIGYTFEEGDRFARFQKAMAADGWATSAPLFERPWVSKPMATEMVEAVCRLPRLYGLGASHNNCGGACVKGGLSHWRWVLRELPEVYADWEAKELAHQKKHGHTSTILRDRRGGVTTPYSLRQLRMEAQRQPDLFAGEVVVHPCSCFAPVDEESA